MSLKPTQLQTKILRKAKSEGEFDLYRAALEWDVAEPLVIGSRDDLRSQPQWKDRVEPYHHQVTNLITYCRRLPVTLLADDVGLGKTISAGLIASELIARGRLSKLLIVCPKLLGPQWQEELDTKFGLDSEVVTGSDLIHAEPQATGAVITTYHSARMYLDQIPSDRFQMLILDEAHKLRNLYGTDEPPQVALRFRQALEERRFRFVLMLTATPIHNRLWDLYSLVELLTVARGHENPFGSVGLFTRKFIADARQGARRLKPDAREEFRSIVYSYMSRVRRQDAKLYFPEREVLLRRVEPTVPELELIEVLKKYIQELNVLVQISILQALTSSPHALVAQLNNMEKKETVPKELAYEVRSIVSGMGASAKLLGLETLIETLKLEDPMRWRLVIFTGRLETQTTIQIFLEQRGLKVGIINGSTGSRNQETLKAFRSSEPDLHVIVSTEAGSEGVNLQVANVLVNYDLPWNPMIVEQRIGRVQRLASDHAKVAIFNIILEGTFEEYIVGRLMEKLQMAAHAIGDIESLLEASGIDGAEGRAKGFEEQIRQLVLAALTGKDYELATRQAIQSLEAAKVELEREEEQINALLGGMEGAGYTGPQAPDLPEPERSMEFFDFTTAALKYFGADLEPQGESHFECLEDGKRRLVKIGQNGTERDGALLYSPESPAFLTLVDRVVKTGIHKVVDLDTNARAVVEELAFDWVRNFGGQPTNAEPVQVHTCFDGSAIVRARSTVAHDSYERLVEVTCSPNTHRYKNGTVLTSLPPVIEKFEDVGIDSDALMEAVLHDSGIAEFRRFYLERKEVETQAVITDETKRQKLENDFTPRLETRLVALDGSVFREVTLSVDYIFGPGNSYRSTLTISPHDCRLIQSPALEICSESAARVPADCLAKCEISEKRAMRHLLLRSEVSGRHALPGNTVVCTLSGKRVLLDEAERSVVSGNLVSSDLLDTSEVSDLCAEPEHMERCEFTNVVALKSELATSDFSGRRYRVDQKQTSAVSGMAGHSSEFVVCHETRQPLSLSEAEQCEVTKAFVCPGVLEQCAITQSWCLPSELERCTVTGKRVLKSRLVKCSVSREQVLDEIAVASEEGKYCCPNKALQCEWSGVQCHPDDIVTCDLTGSYLAKKWTTESKPPRLKPLVALLNGRYAPTDMNHLWAEIEYQLANVFENGKCNVESTMLSPDGWRLAVCCKLTSLLGMRVRYSGMLLDAKTLQIVGEYTVGKRRAGVWRNR